MSPKESPKKISLIQFLDQFAYKEEVQDILSSFDMPVSGTKDELLQRLKKTLSSEDPGTILNKISKDSLKNACDYYGLPVGGTKDVLIERVLNDIITTKSAVVEKSSTKSEKITDKSTKVGSKKDHLNEILNGLSKGDIERGLKDLGQSTSGSKEDMIQRLLTATKNDPKRTLMSLDGQMLNNYADDNNIPRKRSKEDQVNEILRMEFGMDALSTGEASKKKITDEKEPIGLPISSSHVPNNAVSRSVESPNIYAQNLNILFDKVVKDIEDWLPKASWPKEAGYQSDLVFFLESRNHKTRIEKGESRIDILVDDFVPIELKLSPDRQELERAFSQIFRHLDVHRAIIVVVCKPRNQDAMDDFQIRIMKYAKPHGYYYKMVLKK
jgi:hypothetical protein